LEQNKSDLNCSVIKNLYRIFYSTSSLANVLFEKIGNNPKYEKYYLRRLKEIREASLEFDPQTRKKVVKQLPFRV